jgi:hypothetical protein
MVHVPYFAQQILAIVFGLPPHWSAAGSCSKVGCSGRFAANDGVLAGPTISGICEVGAPCETGLVCCTKNLEPVSLFIPPAESSYA